MLTDSSMRFGGQSLLEKVLMDAFWWPESASKSAYGRHPRAESFDPRHMLDGMQTVKAPAE